MNSPVVFTSEQLTILNTLYKTYLTGDFNNASFNSIVVGASETEGAAKVEIYSNDDGLVAAEYIEKVTNIDGDGLLSLLVGEGSGTGYAVHAIAQGSGDRSGLGGASDCLGTANGIVGNRIGTGAGHGTMSTRWDAGNGSGVYGRRLGTGVGSGVTALKEGDGDGHGLYASKTGNGIGKAAYIDGDSFFGGRVDQTMSAELDAGWSTVHAFNNNSSGYSLFIQQKSTLSGISHRILHQFASGDQQYIEFDLDQGMILGTFNNPRLIVKKTGVINFVSTPTSPSGLAAGDIYNDSGTLKIV